MKISTAFVAWLAAAQTVIGSPFAESQDSLSPVGVNSVVCDGDSYKCTALLDFGDGRWVAQWNTNIFHTGLFGSPDHQDFKNLAMAPVRVKKVECDGDRYQCTANLEYGDGRWVAQWSASVFHRDMFSHEASTMAPVPVTELVCDGASYKCTASLMYGDGHWSAEWGASVFHTSGFVQQKISNMYYGDLRGSYTSHRPHEG